MSVARGDLKRLAAWLLYAVAHMVVLVALSGALVTRASAQFDISALKTSLKLHPFLSSFEDRSGDLTLEQVQVLRDQGKFEPLQGEASFGFTRSAIWLSWQGENHDSTTRRWLLELAYPHVDRIDFHVVHEDGLVESRRAGDLLPFDRRDYDDPNFAFALDTKPYATDTYFLRIHTSGSARAPLKAWNERAFLAESTRRSLILALFCGALIVMALFNLGVFALIRQREYLHYVLLLSSMLIAQTSFSGHVFQYLLPDHPLLANRVIIVSLAFMLMAIPLFARSVVRRFEIERELVLYTWCIRLAWLLLLFAMFAPLDLALRGVLSLMACACVAALPHLRTLGRYKIEQARLYLLSWHVVIYSIPIFVLRLMHVIPEFWVSEWIVQITATSSAVITSLALASRVNVLKDDLARLNGELSANVSELKNALASAEVSAEEARRANRVKDDFMATMSHELRTPLNAIINVPQGLIDEFGEVAAARCERCDTTFVLDAEDKLELDTACAACGTHGSLRAISRLEYRGEPDGTIRYLRKVERAGKHLLSMVNGVLDISKLEAGRLELSLHHARLDEVIQEAIEQLSELAAQKSLRVEVELPAQPSTSTIDAFRIKQVLINLLSNAFKFSDAEKTVTVRWEIVGDADVVSVRDQGIGIAPGNHERIFSGFEQVHTGDTRKYGGTGLGLSISRSLVRMHGGDLWVESELGSGAIFRFSLPRTRPTLSSAP
jgi:signal transduction histidine kinase